MTGVSIEKALSPQRLAAYRRTASEPLETVLARYQWNIQISEALYPYLHYLEVGLRNHVHASISQTMGERWFENAKLIHPREASKIEEAKKALINQQKPTAPGRIIAELRFGFWCSLFDLRYEQSLWNRGKHLEWVFPYMNKSDRTRKGISTRLNLFRNLRNRIFHYEPIWHWANLQELRNSTKETIGWMTPEMSQIVESISRFDEVARKNTRNFCS